MKKWKTIHRPNSHNNQRIFLNLINFQMCKFYIEFTQTLSYIKFMVVLNNDQIIS